MEVEILQLKSLVSKMKIEKLVFGSLKHEKLTEEFIDKFVSTMESVYDCNIIVLENIIKKIEEVESKNTEKDGK